MFVVALFTQLYQNNGLGQALQIATVFIST